MSSPSDDGWEPLGLVRLAHSLATGVTRPPLPAEISAGTARQGLAVNPGTLAIGWGTVDLERSAADLPDLSFEPVPDDEALGARALIAHPGLVDLVLLEPSTEGRLAGTLARRGEGVCVYYEQSRGVAPEGATKMTPLGRMGRLVALGRRWGPFLIVIE